MGKDRELFEAARNGNVALVGKILDQVSRRVGPLSSFRRSPSINGQDSNGYTPLHHACLCGHSHIVQLLLAHEATVDVPDIRGSTPLYLAAWAGHQDIVKMLLMHKNKPANPNAQTIENETPLHCAAQHGHNTVLAILLAYGGNPVIRNNSFQTALDLAAQFGRLQAVQILIRTHPELIEPFKQHNTTNFSVVSPRNKHIFTHTCLHLASRNGHKSVVETLLAAGVDANILTNAGSALHEAALCGKKSVVSCLLDAGINPNAVDGNGRTALDLLREYPPHVTYEIVLLIKEFCKQGSERQFRPIIEEYEKKKQLSSENNNIKAANVEEKEQRTFVIVETRLEDVMLETPVTAPPNKMQSATSNSIRLKPPEFYLKMKPIVVQKPTIVMGPHTENVFRYKPVYKPPYITSLINRNENHTNGESIKQKSSNGHEDNFVEESGTASRTKRESPIKQIHCVDEYVKMTKPTSPEISANFSPVTPLPSPRSVETADYANIDIISPLKISPRRYKQSSITPTRSFSTDANNNRSEHSSTPEFPPPSVTQAEHTILAFMKPPVKKYKRRSLRIDLSNENLENLETLFLENLSLTNSPVSNNSRLSDCVEEFVGDVPFAGLLKGSSLNLNNCGIEENNINPLLEYKPALLRSPSLVRSIKPIPAKRNMPLPEKGSSATDNLNETQIWNEIDIILESIGNEVSNAEITQATEKLKPFQNGEDPQSAEPESSEMNFKMREPADLLLGIASNTAANWCHTADELIYGEILYNVYYLGSTVIKELHGTASTRKSIQKLKIDESLVEEQDQSLLKDCNSSTKFLKANKQIRLEVTIALSHTGVRFMDIENKATISRHETQNINCVCQDAEDLRYFAYLTKEDGVHYCHVFMVDNLALVKEIILTLGQVFEVAYQLALIRNESLIEAETNIFNFDANINEI